MASKTHHFLFFLAFLSPFTLSTAARDPCTTAGSDDLSIIPITSKCSPFTPTHAPSASVMETVLNMASSDSHRLSYLSNLVAGKPKPTSVPIASGNQLLHTNNYIVQARLGTPPQLMYMVLDTSNDAVWLPCSGCSGCSTTSKSFNTSSSSTYATVYCSNELCTQARGLTCPSSSPSPPSTCSFNRTYAGASPFTANLVQDTLTLASDVIPNFSFGCISSVSGNSLPPQGLMGLGRGPMSLISQTTSRYEGVFSYCFPSFKSFYFSGSLKLGPVGQPRSIRYTPLLSNPRRPSLYYVNLTGVSIGSVQVPVDVKYLTFDSNSGAGTIIDSGTTITRFVQPVYEAIRDEFRKQVNGPFSTLGAFDTCFAADNENVAPKITLHMTSLDLKLPLENTLIHSSAGTLACLSMAAAPLSVDAVLNVIANLQQQNLRVLFDVPNSRIGIAPENCN